MNRNQSQVDYETFSATEGQAEAFAVAIERVKGELDKDHAFYVSGEEREGRGSEEERSPADSRITVGRFGNAGREDFDDAVAAARSFLPEWSGADWNDRVEIVGRVADGVRAQRYELAAILAYEVGKPILEALGEVDECVVLIEYYCEQMRRNSGFEVSMGSSDGENAVSVMRPYGVWEVIGPFNFAMALLLGPIAAALIAGNTVLAKPSPHGYLSGVSVYDLFRDAGVPGDALHLLTIPDHTLGDWLFNNDTIDGLTFTGSYDVGMQIYRGFAGDYPRPAICEMGGKNPAIVTGKADLEKAALGVSRSAFGFSGQRCSGCSRVLIENSVKDEFVELLEAARRQVRVASPLDPAAQLGPVVSPESAQRLLDAAAECRESGWPLHGGNRLLEGDFEYGNYVEPTSAEIPTESHLLRDELFTPFVAVHPVSSFPEALAQANGLVFGLTAGLYSEDQAEIERFANDIQAGVIYVNRSAGATTGAWPGVQPFGGWKGSGSTSRGAGGVHYLQQYMREQSRTYVE